MTRAGSAKVPDVLGIENAALDYMTIMMHRDDPVWFIENVLDQKMFPEQANTVRAIYRHKYNPTMIPYKKAIIGWGQRSGKTALASMMGLYDLFDLCCLENPSKHYNLLKGQLIMIPVLAPSEDQVMRGVFGNMTQYVQNNKFLREWMGWSVSKYEISCPDKGCAIEPFSSWATTGRGTTAKCVIFDELDMFEDTTSVKRGTNEVFAAMTKATATLKQDAHTIAISSLKSATSKMSQLIREAELEHQLKGDNATTYYSCKPTWEVNPYLTKEELMKEFEFDLPTFWRDYGCKPSMWSAMEFPDGVELTQMTNVLHPGYRDPMPTMRVMAIDPAVKNDCFGVAVGRRRNDGTVVVDGAIKWRKKEGDIIIKPSEIKKFLEEAIVRLGIHTLVFDVWMFPDVIEMAQNMGLNCQKHIVMKEDYDNLRSLMSQQKCSVVYDLELKKELDELEIKGEKRVDHPLNGSKDCADCVANVVWALTGMEQPEMLINLPVVFAF